MSEIPILEIGAGGAFALLIIKEFRNWGTSLLAKKNGNGNNGSQHKSSTLCNTHTNDISANKTEVLNIKEVFRELKKENKADHDETKRLIVNGGSK